MTSVMGDDDNDNNFLVAEMARRINHKDVELIGLSIFK